MTRLKQFAPLGTIIRATYIEADIINALAPVVQYFRPSFTLPEDIAEYLAAGEDSESNECALSEYLNNDLWELMQEFAAPGTYFGAHYGDGSDFGYWECETTSEDMPATW